MRGELTELLGRLVSIESVNPELVPGGAGEAEIAGFVAAWLRGRGLEVTVEEVAPRRPNVVATARGAGGGRSLMLNAHLDTVGSGGMVEPFVPRAENGRLHGRGAYDMKASLAAVMRVIAEAARRELAGDVILTAVADEEAASIGTEAVAASLRADAAIVAEPTELRLAVAHRGFAWLEIETRGVAAHGSLYDSGVDAIARMGHVLVALERLDRSLREGPLHPLLGGSSAHAGLIDGGEGVSTYPDRCALQLERRTLPGETREQVEAEARGLLGDLDGSVRLRFERQALETSPDEPIVQALAAAARDVCAGEPELVGVPFWTDAALLSAAGIPAVVFGPAGEGAHADVEWVDLESVERCYEVLLATTIAFCARAPN